MRLFYKKFGLLIIFLALSIIFINAQNSFYSGYGLGSNYPGTTTRMEAMGYSGSAIYDSLSVASYNPAVWHSFYSVSLQGKLNYSTMNSTKREGDFNSANLNGFAVKMPLGNYSGMAFGIKPSYRTRSESHLESTVGFFGDSLGYADHVIAKGGISEFFIGGGYRLTRYISAGLMAKFLFGKYSTQLKTEINSKSYYYNKQNSIKGQQLGAGLFLNVPENYSISLYYDRNINFKYNKKVDHHLGKGDTSNYKSANYPAHIKFGVGKFVSPRLVLTADLNYSKMPGNNADFSFLGKGVNQDSYLIGAGIESRPSPEEYQPSFFENMFYRAGLYYREDGIKVDEEKQLTEMGISLGAGIPFHNNFSRFDFALIYSLTDGFLSQEIGKENKIAINISITSGGLWFFNALRR
jgi:hypothetical protein